MEEKECPNCGAFPLEYNPTTETYHCNDCNSDFDEDELDNCDERLSVYDAADIWMSSGFDEDQMFGYTVEELEKALKS